MKYLLDSSVWMRSALQGRTLPGDIRTIIGDPAQKLGLSLFSLWEAAKKHQRGKLTLPMDITVWLKAAVPENVQLLPLTADILLESTRLPDFPNNDPADEIIVATARVHQLTLMTTDTKLRHYRHANIQYFKPLT